MLPGSAIAMRKVPLSSAYGTATTRSSTCNGTSLSGLLVDARQGEVDERYLVAHRQRARDAFAGRDALLDHRLRDRAARGAAAHERQLVGRNEPGGREQVDDELRRDIDGHPGS